MHPYSLRSRAVAHNMHAVGYTDLDGRPGFKMSIREADGRWYLYLGHFWHSGWSIVDVTDPAAPMVAAFVPGPANTATLQMEIADATMVTALEKILPGFGGDPDQPFDEGVLLWDLGDPLHPRRRGQFRTGGTGTHRNFYAGGRYMHLAAGMPGYDGNIYVIVDINDPEHPVEAGRWWMPGQHRAGGETPAKPGISLHGPAEVVGALAYLPYGAAGMIVLDIGNVAAPRPVSQLSWSPPFRSKFCVHSIVPHPGRGLAYVNSEGAAEYCAEGLDHASVVDISDPTHPTLLAVFPRPVPPPGVRYVDFCERGGWFGPHNQNQLHHNPAVQPQGDVVYLTYFNAGLRVYDVSNPRQPTEVGYFLPPDPTRRYGPVPPSTLVVQSEDVLVDRRGYIYVTDKHQGLWIIRYDGPGAMG